MQKLDGNASNDFVAVRKHRTKLNKHPDWDKFPGPYTGDFRIKPGESPEERAFRRFPIDSHKPGNWNAADSDQPPAAPNRG